MEGKGWIGNGRRDGKGNMGRREIKHKEKGNRIRRIKTGKEGKI